MIRRPPRSTRTDTLCPYTTLFRSVPRRKLAVQAVGQHLLGDAWRHGAAAGQLLADARWQLLHLAEGVGLLAEVAMDDRPLVVSEDGAEHPGGDALPAVFRRGALVGFAALSLPLPLACSVSRAP